MTNIAWQNKTLQESRSLMLITSKLIFEKLILLAFSLCSLVEHKVQALVLRADMCRIIW